MKQTKARGLDGMEPVGGAPVAAKDKAKDDLQPVGEDPKRDAAIAAHNAGETKSQDLEPVGDVNAHTQAMLDRLKFLENKAKRLAGKPGEVEAKAAVEKVREILSSSAPAKESGAKDAEPTPIKTTNLETMPDGPNGNATYAEDAVGEDDMRADKVTAGMKFVTAKGDLPIKKIHQRSDGDIMLLVEDIHGKDTWLHYRKNEKVPARDTAKGKAKDTAMQHAGSEPQDHLARGMQYEVGQDKARALDSYRAAATGFRRANDARESQARDGITACQRAITQGYDGMYHHPNAGKTRVCDSADAALRTALERTRAGEVVSVDGSTVRPGVAKANDEAELPEAAANDADPELAAYAKACNLDPEDIAKHMQRDPDARKQFESWKKSKGKDKSKANDASNKYGILPV